MKNSYLFCFLLFTLFAFGQKNKNTVGFIENKGQIIDQKGKANNSVLYLLNTNGLNVQLKKNSFSYDIYETEKIPSSKKEKQEQADSFLSTKENQPDYSVKYRYHRIDIDFVNSNPNVNLISEEKSSDYDNYYNVAHAPQGITNVHKFKKVTYQNIYNNIDVVFFIPKDSTKAVEYNFVVKPGGKISDIQLQFNGAKTELADNKITMNVRFGKMEETLPLSWIENGGERKEIAVGYKKIKKNLYGFEGDVNSSNKTIVIDPTPVRLWGTYYAGNNGEFASDICNDNNNNVYFSGYTRSTINIATIGTIPESTSQSYHYGHGFIAKFNTNGTRIWGTYYSARPQTVEADYEGNLYFAGTVDDDWLGITNVSSPNSHQEHTGNEYDAFLVKLNSSGIREWGTYYGGNLWDEGKDICFDNQNNIYLVGYTESNNNIATVSSHQPAHSPSPIHSNNDGFIVKFTAQGIRVWGTYFGGKETDRIVSCDISDDGFLYVAGVTYSNDGIATPGSYQPNYIGYTAGMMAKFTLDGQRVWGSYFNGNTMATISKIKIRNENIYFYGKTNSQTNLLTSNTFNETFQHLYMQYGTSSYIVKFNLNTQSQTWGTYFGEIIQDLEVNSNNQVFIEGCTDHSTGIATPGAYSTINQYGDAYVIKLSENGQREWGTYYGGNSSEGVNGAADVCNKMSLDLSGNIYLVGNTHSINGISTPGAHQETHMQNSLGGIYNIYLAKLQDCQSAVEATSNSPICIGNTLELHASGGTDYLWTGPNGFNSIDQNPIITNATATQNGLYTCAITGTAGCDNTISITVFVGDAIAPIPNTGNLSTITGDCNTTISTIPTATDNCAGIINATTTDPLSYSIPGNYTIHWNYNDGNGNSSTQNQNVTITATALPTLNSPQDFCIQQNATLNSIIVSGQNIQWYDALTGGNLLVTSTILQNGMTYYASQTINGCESARASVMTNVQNTPAPTGNQNQSFCATQNPTLADIAVTGTAINWYSTATSPVVLPLTTTLINGATYYATQTVNSCESVNRLPVTIILINTLNASGYAESLCDDLNNGTETVVLTDYNSQLISDTSNCTFSYYDSITDAENQNTWAQIINYANYPLELGIKTIYVRIDSSNGCHQIVELKLTLLSKPVISISDIMPICEGSSITVNAGNGYDNYLWSTGETTSSIIITNPGNYEVTVSENHGALTCSSVKRFTVVHSNAATISEVITSDWTYNENTITALLTGNSVGDYVYSLDGINYQSSNTFSGLESGEYTVYVKDKNGCGIDSEEFYLLMYPKYFTPNGDGYHDTWQIKFSDNEPGLRVKLFDRFGKLLKELDNTTGWNGTFNNQELPAADYWFTVIRANGKEYKGHFALKR